MSGDRRRVLVIEDDHALAKAVANLLQDAGFAVEQRHDGESGFAEGLVASTTSSCWTSCCPSATASASVRTCAPPASTPAVDADGQRREWDEVEGLEVGADDFMHKPFENSILIAHLHALLRRHDVVAPTIGRRSDLARSATPIGRRLRPRRHVDPREFALLEFLMERMNEPLAKSEILHAVWARLRRRPQHRRGLHWLPSRKMPRSVRVGDPHRAGHRLQHALGLMPRLHKFSIRARLTSSSSCRRGDPQCHRRVARSPRTPLLAGDADNEIQSQMIRTQEIFANAKRPTRIASVLAMHGDVVIQVTNLAGTKVWAASSAIAKAPVLARSGAPAAPAPDCRSKW